MKRTVVLSFCLIAGNALADTGSPQLKAESQSVIRQAGYQCDTVNSVYPAAFGGSLTVSCDSDHKYIIRKKDGQYTVEKD
ncbi:hypothetical protein RJE46_16900 [Cedecea neteri]|uniref:DUF1496 domain-containing protein n=1 Tax=Cedecea neteri TaxID=158822 RepID=A0AAN0S511_9ENTR|nr:MULTISPECIES: hypothetical protein [Cedecea]AIR61325.1 hypothetical protein LH23_11870 [Cedecea neteri]NIG74524.1 hypothetical protein [Klebsiella sp. Ap-873]WNJ78296.1 hypothetical protein RJE46_16900 [Cedecea neteri]SMG43473.1 hypothetical protein SAMN03159353_1010143 [Cedecea sp. NFIX57]